MMITEWLECEEIELAPPPPATHYDDPRAARVCPICHGSAVLFLGRLGSLGWYECRDCGLPHNDGGTHS